MTGSVEMWGLELDTGHLIPFYKVPYSKAYLDNAGGTGSSSLLLKYGYPWGDYIDEPLRSDLLTIIGEVWAGGNPGAYLGDHAGYHRFIDDVTGDPTEVAKLFITPGARTWESLGYGGWAGQRGERNAGTWDGEQYAYAVSPSRWVGGRSANFNTRFVWSAWREERLHADSSRTNISSIRLPLGIVLTSDNYLVPLEFTIGAAAQGALFLQYQGLRGSPFGGDVMPNFRTQYIKTLRDYDDEDGDDDMPRFSPRTATSTVGTYFLDKDMVHAFIGQLWDSNLIENIRAAFIGDGSNAILGLQWFYGLGYDDGADVPKSQIGSYITLGNVAFKDVPETMAHAATRDFMSFDFGSVQVPRFHGDWRDWGVTSYKLYLPFVGIIDLDPQDVAHQDLHLKYFVNLTDGSCVAQLTQTGSGHDPTGLVFQASGQWGYDIPVKVDSARDFSTSLARVLGVPLGGAADSAQSSRSYAAGSLAPNANVMGGLQAKLIAYHREEIGDGQRAATVGHQAGSTPYPLSSYTGYVKARQIVNGGSLAMRQSGEIIALLQEGIYL